MPKVTSVSREFTLEFMVSGNKQIGTGHVCGDIRGRGYVCAGDVLEDMITVGSERNPEDQRIGEDWRREAGMSYLVKGDSWMIRSYQEA